jgi:hypothetical protein
MLLRLAGAFALSVVVAAPFAIHAAPVAQPAAATIVGAWVLNPALTQRPPEVGFTPAWARAQGSGGDDGGRSGGGRGRRGGSGSGGGATGVPPISRESADDSTRVQQLTGEARTPPSRLTIVQKDSAISIADDQGHVRTFRPDGRLAELTIGTVPLPTTARWDGTSLVVVYDLETGRQLRYTYTPSPDAGRGTETRCGSPTSRRASTNARSCRERRSYPPHRQSRPRRRRGCRAARRRLRVLRCCLRDRNCAG